jgi:predicted tellurium resistance membrane protein TerC
MLELFTFENAIAFVTLAALEIVLGIDNIVFLSILAGKLPKEQQAKARQLGLFGAMFMRVGLLLAISWIMRLTAPLFTVLSHTITGRDLILLLGGVFLIGKSTFEIHESIDPHDPDKPRASKAGSFAMIVGQIMIMDIVFSLDSVITAVGMANNLVIMIAAVVLAIVIMLLFSNYVGEFIHKNPSIKVLALAFLLLIGVMLTAEGLGKHIERGYIYFAMAFSFCVELVNMRARRKAA